MTPEMHSGCGRKVAVVAARHILLMAHLECYFVPDGYRWFACRAPIKACTNNYASIVGQFFRI